MSVVRGIRGLLKSASGFSKGDSLKDFAGQHPLAAFGLVAPTAGFLGSEVVAPIAQGAANLTGIPALLERMEADERAKRLKEERSSSLHYNMRQQRIEEMVQRNMAVVAQRDPHLFNQVMSGRVLPQGAVVLGGPRRQDLMEELAYAMGTSQTPEDFTSLVQ